MSCNYADGLSPYEHKGKLGLAEKFDTNQELDRKVEQLAKWMETSKHVVFHTGAGISTSAGIPDFRGPKGVWTLEKKGLKPEMNVSFDDAVPTKTHMALVQLVECGKVQYVVSQNIDGLHLRSGLPREHLGELHGNMYVDQCNQCDKQFVRAGATTSVGQKCLDIPCPSPRRNGRSCRGRLHDTILDWEHNLPEMDLQMADHHSRLADLSICLGTTLQIIPSGNLPLHSKKRGGHFVVCNLQPTKHDKKADLVINAYVDEIIIRLMSLLNLVIPQYSAEKDPSKLRSNCNDIIEWTINTKHLKQLKLLYESECSVKQQKRKQKDVIKEETKRTITESQVFGMQDVEIKQ